MANFRRNRPVVRTTQHSVKSMHSEPKWWTVQFHTRPKRRREERLRHLVERDMLDADDTAFPLGNHKPHNYFW